MAGAEDTVRADEAAGGPQLERVLAEQQEPAIDLRVGDRGQHLYRPACRPGLADGVVDGPAQAPSRAVHGWEQSARRPGQAPASLDEMGGGQIQVALPGG